MWHKSDHGLTLFPPTCVILSLVRRSIDWKPFRYSFPKRGQNPLKSIGSPSIMQLSFSILQIEYLYPEDVTLPPSSCFVTDPIALLTGWLVSQVGCSLGRLGSKRSPGVVCSVHSVFRKKTIPTSMDADSSLA